MLPQKIITNCHLVYNAKEGMVMVASADILPGIYVCRGSWNIYCKWIVSGQTSIVNTLGEHH